MTSARQLSRFLLVLGMLTAFCGCLPGPRLRKANVDQVTNGMAKKQVESILGPPTSVSEVKDLDATLKTTYVYLQGKDTVTIVLFDDKVESKLSTLKD